MPPCVLTSHVHAWQCARVPAATLCGGPGQSLEILRVPTDLVPMAGSPAENERSRKACRSNPDKKEGLLVSKRGELGENMCCVIDGVFERPGT